MTDNSGEEEEKREEQQKSRLYIIQFEDCNHTRVVDAQYVHDAAHRIAGDSFYICDKCETGELRRVAEIRELP